MNLEYLIFDESVRTPETLMNYKNSLKVLMVVCEKARSLSEVKEVIEELYYGNVAVLGEYE